MPDVFVPVDTSRYSTYYRDLVAKGVITKYVLNYIESHRKELLKQYPDEETFATQFSPSQQMADDLIAAATAAGVEFRQEGWDTSRTLILAIVKGLMTRDLYENGIYVRSTNPLSPDFNEALRLINDPERYNAILRGRKQ